MIITVTQAGAGTELAAVARSLALLRARGSGRKVMLIDTGRPPAAGAPRPDRSEPKVAMRSVPGCELVTQLEQLRPHYHDIVIAADCRDPVASRTALIAARLAVVPVTVEQADVARQYQLIARLNEARMFSPGLKVMFVLAGDARQLDGAQLAQVRTYVSQVMAATLAGTVIPPQPGEQDAADAMGELYEEIYA